MTRVESYFTHIVIAVMAIKVALAYFIPVTADEAYFWVWGQHVDINYYDHPPVTGWVVALFSLLGDHIFFSRLFSILSGGVIAWGIYITVRDAIGFPDRAKLISLAFLVCPLHILFVFITTDTPVFLLVFLAGLAFYHSLQRHNSALMILAGALCGLAILSKYFAGLLGIAFLVVLVCRRGPRVITNAFLLLIGVLPFILFHLYGNYTTCWTNVLFNVYNRNRQTSWEISGFFLFLAFQIYLATPWVLYHISRNFKSVIKDLNSGSSIFALLFFVPMVIFGIIAFHDTGLHWTLAFIPFIFLLLIYVKREAIVSIITCSMVFSLVHLLIITIALALPIRVVQNQPYYNDVVMAYHGPEIHKKIRDRYGPEYLLATNGYYTSSAMTYHGGEYFIVFMDDSKHGRYDDKITDYRQLNGKNIISLRTLPVNRDYKPFFEKVTVETLPLHGGKFYLVVGEGFKYQAYRDLFLSGIRDRLYNVPEFLPIGQCYFFDMYFDGEPPGVQ